MPKNRPGRMHYTTATKAVDHGRPAVENGICGVAVKQKTPGSTLGLADTAHYRISVGEPFAMIVKGYVEVDHVATASKGDAIYIVPGTNALTLTPAGNVPFGRVIEVAGERGLVSGKLRVDLDMKPTG